MTTALEIYKAKRQAAAEAESFAALMSGATASATCTIEITRNGQTIPMPASMLAAVSAAVSARAGTVLNAAAAAMKQEAIVAGFAARDEYLNLLQADGIITQGG